MLMLLRKDEGVERLEMLFKDKKLKEAESWRGWRSGQNKSGLDDETKKLFLKEEIKGKK